MSLFANLSKFFTCYFGKGSLATHIAGPNVGSLVAKFGSELTRALLSYDCFCTRQTKQILPASKTSCAQSSSIDARQQPLSRPTFLNACSARFFSINSQLALHSEQKNAVKLLKKGPFCSPMLQHQSVRIKCGRENCRDPCDYPLCPPFNKRYEREPRLFNIYHAYWDERDNPCCQDECMWTHPHPRFDDLYLKESDKEKRRYMRTWTECARRIKPKCICCYEGEPPEICFRPKKDRPKTACPPNICLEGDQRCPKITLPGCCAARMPPCCKKTRSLVKCKKFCTPYPSYSECQKPKAKPRRGVECGCLHKIPMCEYWAYWRKRILNRMGEKC